MTTPRLTSALFTVLLVVWLPTAGRGEPPSLPPDSPGASTADLGAATFHDAEPQRGRATWRLASPQAAQLLRDRDFDGLERLAADWRTKKVRDDDGMWMLRRLYEATSAPKKPSEDTWKTILGRLDEWQHAKPRSVTAKIAAAEAWTAYGWFARNAASTPEAKAASVQIFRERHQKGEQILNAAEALSERCPELYAAWHLVAMGLDWPRERYDAMYQKAIAFEPTYYDYYLSAAFRLLPRWGGQPREWREFALKVAEQTREREGMSIYARIVTHVWDREGKNPFGTDGADWPKAQQGYIELAARYPKSTWFLNHYALMAYYNRDSAVAGPLVAKIGDGFLPAVWGNAEYFGKVHTWAAETSTADGREWQKRMDEARTAMWKRDFAAADQALHGAAKFVDAFPENDKRHGETLESIANLAMLETDYPKAREVMERAIAAYEKTAFVEQPQFAKSLTMLGFMQGAAGEWATSFETQRRLVEFLERHPSPTQQKDLEQALTNWMHAARELGRTEEADALQKRLGKPSEPGAAPSPSLAAEHERAARDAAQAGRLGDADRETRIAMKLVADQSDAENEQARMLTTLSAAYSQHGRGDRAIELMQEVRKIRARGEGAESPGVADALLQEAGLHDLQKRPKQALELSEKALAMLEKTVGPTDARTIRAVAAVARLHRELGDEAKAEAMLQGVLARVDRPDAKGMTIVEGLVPLEEFYISESRYPEAEKLLRRHLYLVQADPEPANRVYNEPSVCMRLTRVLASQGKTDEAESYYRQAAESAEANQGPKHLNAGQPFLEWARFLAKQGKDDQAEKLFDRATHVFEQAGPMTRETLAKTLEEREKSLRKLGRGGEADVAAARAKAVRESIRTNPARMP